MRSLFLAALISSGLIGSEPFTKTEVGLEVAYQMLLLADWRQTSDFHKMGYTDANGVEHSVGERNWLLGSHPRQATINLACLVSAVGHFLISRALDGKDRLLWQSVTVGLEAYAVGNNYSVGVRVRF